MMAAEQIAGWQRNKQAAMVCRSMGGQFGQSEHIGKRLLGRMCGEKRTLYLSPSSQERGEVP
jgi:hypothetical protein